METIEVKDSNFLAQIIGDEITLWVGEGLFSDKGEPNIEGYTMDIDDLENLLKIAQVVSGRHDKALGRLLK
jgi:hypothetical protein